MRMKTLVQAASAAVMLAAVGTGVASPASAAEVGTAATTINYTNAQVSFDNNPGNGSESWIWGWNGNSNGVRFDYQHYDNSINSLWVGANSSASANPSKDIWRVRYCFWDSRSQAYGCGSWS
ncbi:hypothetical protein FB570_111230 [Streptomyces sp. T12]|nr:hypothetical protein FB570_111230 [Streptomyces sp. T12]